mgnify:CR=1 FL=1
MLKKILIVGLSVLIGFTSTMLSAQTSEFVKRAVISSAIENREPVDNLSQIGADINKVYFFTEITNKANTMITHRWFLNGRLEAEVVLKIGSDRWRTYSSKNLVPTMHTGDWQVEVVDETNKMIGSATFSY